MMLNHFLNNIEKQKLINYNDKILLTVSGGADSVLMTHLFSLSKYNFAIAHCNFKLRGNDSEQDEIFVKKIAEKYNVKIHVKTCEAKEFGIENNISLEMAAREMRYKWFEELSLEYGYTKIATAHHLNDSVETILLNLIRKTGIRGLLGIPAINRKIIRPLLFATKNEILEYLEQNKLEYRTDKTNFETEFQRNKLRNLIIPEIEKINPAFSSNLIASSKNISQYYELFKEEMKKFENKCIQKDDFGYEIDLLELENFKPKELFLFEFLREFNFNSSQVKDILDFGEVLSGKKYFSDSFELVVNRKKIILSEIIEQTEEKHLIDLEIGKKIKIHENKFDEIELFIELKTLKDFVLIKDKNIAYFDFEKIKFPIKIRKWQEGDYFFPFGMSGKKKISDYFNDNKFSSKEKSKTWLLETDGNIIWIIKNRTDNRYKVEKETEKILVIRIL